MLGLVKPSFGYVLLQRPPIVVWMSLRKEKISCQKKPKLNQNVLKKENLFVRLARAVDVWSPQKTSEILSELSIWALSCRTEKFFVMCGRPCESIYLIWSTGLINPNVLRLTAVFAKSIYAYER